MSNARSVRPNRSAGFTLIEILVVVIILGVLAGIVVPRFLGVTNDAERAAFINDLRIFGDAAMVMRAQTGDWPEDSSSGNLPAGFDSYIDETKWVGGTPLGGVWDAENGGDFPAMSAGLGVHFNSAGARDDAFMLEIDRAIDDGDLSTGMFQKIASDRYYRVLAR